MRIKKRRNLPNEKPDKPSMKPPRNPSTSRLLPKGESYYANRVLGSVEYRTPAVCNKWPNEFRVRLLKGYVPPATPMHRSEFMERCVEYRGAVDGHDVSVKYPIIRENNDTDTFSVYGTVIVDHDNNKKLLLSHDTDAARFLIVLCFLHSIIIPGIPKLHVTDYEGD